VPGQAECLNALIYKDIKYLLSFFLAEEIRLTELTAKSRSENRMRTITRLAPVGARLAGERARKKYARLKDAFAGKSAPKNAKSPWIGALHLSDQAASILLRFCSTLLK
jgi:hypothetical protein